MSLLKNLTNDASIAGEKDNLGGGSNLRDAAIYASKIGMAYLHTSDKGAMALALTFVAEDKKEIRETVYFTSGKDKGCKNTYQDKDGHDQYLPGYLLIDSLCLLTVGKNLTDMDHEEKSVKIYDFDAKAELPKSVQVLTELIGQEVHVGLIRMIENKRAKNDAGFYVDTNDQVEKNQIDKFFRAEDKLTVAEIRAGATEAAFYDAWNEKNKGQVRNKFKAVAGAPAAGASKAGGAAPAAKPATSIFGKPPATA